MFRSSYPIIAGIATLLMLICGTTLTSAGAYDDSEPIRCDGISLVFDSDPMNDRALVSAAPAAAPRGCEQIIHEFIDEKGHPFLGSGDWDDIGINNNYNETVDKLCRALLTQYNTGTSKPATACRIGFLSGNRVFEGLLALIRSKQLMVDHPDPSKNSGYKRVEPGACVALPLPKTGNAKNALTQFSVKEFGEGADWASISQHLRRNGFKDAHMSRLSSSYFTTTTGRELTSHSAEYNSEKKGFSITVGIAEHLPAVQFDIGCRFQDNCEPNFLCATPLVIP